MHTPAIGALHQELEAVDGNAFAAFGQATEQADDQPTDRVVFVVREVAAELLVEIHDVGLGFHTPTSAALAQDVVFDLVEIMLVLDVADDLFEYVLDRDESGHAAVLV